MKNNLLLTLLCAFSTFSNVAHANVDEKTLLWMVLNENSKDTSYLYATINPMCKNDLKIHPQVISSMNNCKQILSTIQYYTDTMVVKYLGRTFSDIDIRTIYTEEDLQFIKDVINKEAPALMPIFQRMKPFIIYSTFDTYQLRKKCDSTTNLEMELLKTFKSKSDRLMYLDSFEESFERLANIITYENLLDLMRRNNSSANFSSDIQMSAYREGDAYKAYSLNKDLIGNDNNPQRKYYNLRKNNWLNSIKSAINQNSTFITINLNSLFDDDGIIKSLRKEGFKVISVKLDAKQLN